MNWYGSYQTIVKNVLFKGIICGWYRFGFVTYETMDGVEKCLSEGPHTLDGRTVDVKRAIPKDINRGNNDGIDDSPRTKKVKST